VSTSRSATGGRTTLWAASRSASGGMPNQHIHSKYCKWAEECAVDKAGYYKTQDRVSVYHISPTVLSFERSPKLESSRKRGTNFCFHHLNFVVPISTDLTGLVAQILKIEPLFSFRYIRTSCNSRFIQIPFSKSIVFIFKIFRSKKVDSLRLWYSFYYRF